MPDNYANISDETFDLLAIAHRIANTLSANEQHAAAISLIVSELLNRKEVDNAAQAADSVSDPFTRDLLLMQTAEKCAEIDDDDYALQLSDAIEDPGRKLSAIEKIGVVKARRRQWQKAFEIAEIHPHPDAIIAEIAISYVLHGETEKAIELINSIGFLPAAIDALILSAEEQIKAGKKTEAVAMLERAVGEALDLDQPDEMADKLIAIAATLSAAGRNDLAISNLDHARQAADQIEGVHRDRLLAAVAVGFMNAGSASLAEMTLDSITDLTQLSSALKAISEINRNNGNISEADELLGEAYEVLRSEKDMQRRDSRASFTLQAAIAASFAATNKLDKAIEAAESIPLEDYSQSAFISIAAVLAEQGDTDNARAIVSSITGEAEKIPGLLAIADALKSDPPLAKDFLREAAETVDGVIQESLRVELLGEIISRYLKLGDEEAARNLRKSLIETLPTLRDRFIQIKHILNLGSLFGFGETEYHEVEIQTLLSKFPVF